MNLIAAYKQIKQLNITVFRTSDIAIITGVSNKYGHKLLSQLTNEGFLIHLRRDLWAIKESLDPLILPDFLTAPMPSYISLQSALYYHGLISQIPTVIYAVSIARTKRYETPAGAYSIHHINPELFTGFDIVSDNEIRIAQPEKALFDFFYFKCTKSKLFYALPEVDIPSKFSWKKLQKYAELIGNKSRQKMVFNLISQSIRQIKE